MSLWPSSTSFALLRRLCSLALSARTVPWCAASCLLHAALIDSPASLADIDFPSSLPPTMSTPSLQDILNETDDDSGLLASLPPSHQPSASSLLLSPTDAPHDPFSGLVAHTATGSHSSSQQHTSSAGHTQAADPFSHLLSLHPLQAQPVTRPPPSAAPLSAPTPFVGPDPFALKAAVTVPAASADPFSDLISLSSSSSSSARRSASPLPSSSAPPAAAGLPPSLASLPSVSAGRPSAPVLSLHLATLNNAAASGSGEDSTASSALSSGVSTPLSPSLPHSASLPLSPYSTSASTAQERHMLQSILSEQQTSEEVSSSPASATSPTSSSVRRVTPLTAAEIASIANPLKRAEAIEQQKSLVGNYRLVEPLRAKREQMRAQPVHNILRLQPLAALRAELEKARPQLGEWTCAAIGQRYMAVGTARGCIIVFNHFEQLQCVLGKPAEDVRTRGPVTCIDMNPTGDQVVAGHARGLCAVWDIATRKEVKDIKDASTRPITHVKFTKRGRPVFVAVDDQGIVTLFTLNKVSILSVATLCTITQ